MGLVRYLDQSKVGLGGAISVSVSATGTVSITNQTLHLTDQIR